MQVVDAGLVERLRFPLFLLMVSKSSQTAAAQGVPRLPGCPRTSIKRYCSLPGKSMARSKPWSARNAVLSAGYSRLPKKLLSGAIMNSRSAGSRPRARPRQSLDPGLLCLASEWGRVTCHKRGMKSGATERRTPVAIPRSSPAAKGRWALPGREARRKDPSASSTEISWFQEFPLV